MAVELLAETSSSRGISPRISFSHDLKNCEIVPIESNTPLKSSLLDYDFDFCVSKRNYDQDSSSLADELFANGVILPIQIKRKNIPFISKSKSTTSSSTKSSLFPPLKNSSPSSFIDGGDVQQIEEKQSKEKMNDDDNKSFWKFKRSKSLNCGRIYRRGLCSLPILSRSKSTGSNSSVKKSLISKDEVSNNNSGKIGSLKNSSSHQKPPLKKNYGGGNSFNSGLIQVNPVINVVAGGNLFGFGSLFSSSKDKGKKK